MPGKGWQREFEDPIRLPGQRKLATLRDAADSITSLPKNEFDLPEWQTAIEVLMPVSRSGPTMMARIETSSGCSIPSATIPIGGNGSRNGTSEPATANWN